MYVEPLPSPVSTNSAMNAIVNRGSDFWVEATTMTPVAPAMATKFHSVMRAPP